MKFRCERDTLADAVATAQRAVASRTGAMPVLSGLRVTLTPGSLELVGTDLELTIRVRIPADTDGEGSAVVPARLFSEIVRQLEGDTVSVELADDDARIEAGRFATTLRTLSAAEFPRLPEAERRRGAGRGRGVRRGAAPGGAGRVARRRPPDPHRCAPHRLGRRAAPRGHRLLPAGAARPAGREHARGGPEGPGGGQGAGRGAAAALGRDGRDRGRARRARGRVPRRHHRGHDPADRGRVPELPAAHPERVPEPAHRVA